MTTDANTDLSGAARFGHVLGCGLRRILNVERAFWSLFDRTGVPRVIITPVKWGVRAAVLGTGAFFVAWGLLYVLSIIVLLAIGLGIMNSPGVQQGWLYRSQLVHFGNSSSQAKSSWPEVREGADGYGSYIGDVRVD
ncbi:DUF3742 family protein [Pseudomonas amygdali]|uniref:DUF3742 family protein n=1 Tax=Pseudomonas amygdali TaxID=47877 RepID=UPI000CD1ACC0|nr:DUF3742 family protein [Pseudomonas amygdali]MBI6732805.1 DUF3742 family protein [Pseudomonas amygdali]MBI6810955.1 DUF3742 family protein [Pseudomonas amygdali]POY81114.1 hypothetical protein BKM09_021965 [Pseudomonas amygdali pv. morsprunorum]RMP04185.1 hypothetical protein ALQ31_00628 [Pseudomonas amygdali pv. morsprunorum]